MTISAEKKLGHNTTFKQGATTIVQMQSINIPGYKRDEVDVTTLDSTIMDFIPGDPPEVTGITISGIWVGGLASQELLYTSAAAKTNDTYSIVVNSWTTSRTATFTGYCVGWEPQEVSSKDPLRIQFTIRPTSVITWT